MRRIIVLTALSLSLVAAGGAWAAHGPSGMRARTGGHGMGGFGPAFGADLGKHNCTPANDKKSFLTAHKANKRGYLPPCPSAKT